MEDKARIYNHILHLKKQYKEALIYLILEAIWEFSFHECEFGHNTEPNVSEKDIDEWLVRQER